LNEPPAPVETSCHIRPIETSIVRAPSFEFSRATLDERGQEQVLTKPPGEGGKILAAALHTPGYEEAICFAVDRPQKARFDGASVRISVHPGEPLWFGLASPDQFDNWARLRRKR